MNPRHFYFVTFFDYKYHNDGDYLDTTNRGGFYPTLADTEEAIFLNDFDMWEGFTNKYCVIEEYPVGTVTTCRELAWFTWVPSVTKQHPAVDIIRCEKPKELEGVVNFAL